MAKKSIYFYILTFIALAVIILSVGFGVTVFDDGADAAVNWTARVCVERNQKFVAINSGERITDSNTFTFLISDYTANDTFEYYVSSGVDIANTSSELNKIADDQWTAFKREDMRQDNNGNLCWAAIVTRSSNKETIYVYFRRRYSEVGSAEVLKEYYQTRWQIIINRSLAESDLGIEAVTATYRQENRDVVYDNSRWVGTGITFTVTTVYMSKEDNANEGKFDSEYEMLYYSVDGKDTADRTKTWIPMSYNYIFIKTSINNGNVDFKVTDIAGLYAKYYTYENVKIDVAEPVFNLTATTLDNRGQQVPYIDRAWSCSYVVYDLTDESECISGVTYKYSEDGIHYTNISVPFRVSESKTGIRFRAESGAGVIYDYSAGRSLTVNIDNTQPGIAVKAFTKSPENETREKEIISEFNPETNVYTAIEDANGTLYLDFYNKDLDGKYVENKSGYTVKYSVSVDGGEYGEPTVLSTVPRTDGDFYYYRLEVTPNIKLSTRRIYRFFIESGAGLQTNVTYFDVTILKSEFEVEVLGINPTTSGWSATAIPVYVKVPTDSKFELNYAGQIVGYTTPTTKYTFVYAPTNIAGVTYEVRGEYYSHVENEEGQSIYVFMLSASAESTFSVYAKNGAGKRSMNTFESDNTIKIDVLKPQVEVTAKIKDSDNIYISAGDWVNGRIMLTLSVKDGVSGIIVRDVNFAVDGNGNPVHTSTGELIWQEGAVRLPDRTENGDDGSRYFIYEVEIGPEKADVIRMTKEYRFRVFTGSGVSTDVGFLANIDLSEIILESIEFSTDKYSEVINVISDAVTLPSVCDDAHISLISNDEQLGHFDYYLYNEVSESYEFVEGNELTFSVPSDRKGELRKKLYLVSRAKNYNGVGVTTEIANPYEIIIPYNTLNITINYALNTATSSVGSVYWNDDNLNVTVYLASDDLGTEKDLTLEEKKNYSYYYMLIKNAPGINLGEEIRNGNWILCDGGAYDEVGTGYNFTIDFSHRSFVGYIALSVTNEAGFRSSTTGEVDRILYIDRTTPEISDMIITQSGINEKGFTSEKSKNMITYYSRDAIEITPKNFDDRSRISYYYVQLNGADATPSVETIPSAGEMNGWNVLSQNIILSAEEEAEFYYLFYAVNEKGAYAGGIFGGDYTVYRFVIDKSEMTGTLSYNPNDGGYYDDSLGVYVFMWRENVNISLVAADSKTDVRYFYSTDNGSTWEPYDREEYSAWWAPGRNNVRTLTFNSSYFPDGVNSEFTFKAVNKAGTEYVYEVNIYIAIDTMVPTFDVLLTVNGSEYTGGSTDLSSQTASNWANKAVEIAIKPIETNVSGVRYTYTIEYLVNRTPQTTESREVPAMAFTTDVLDGFGVNRDAVITIKATSRADNTKSSEKKFRVKVDQTVPVFTITGYASNNDNSEEKVISSGEWTNMSTVKLGLTVDSANQNASNVTYTYAKRDLNSTGYVTGDWPDSNPAFTDICTVTVTATTDSGLSYEQTFQVNIDTRGPVIKFVRSESISIEEGGNHYIDLKAYVEGDNLEICEYITIKGDTRGFSFDPNGLILSTSSVDNTVRVDANGNEYRGYVKIYVKDYAGNVATFELYILPFNLDVNNVELSDNHRAIVDGYERDLNAAEEYMEPARVTYFRNLISRLRDRMQTLENEIASYRAYLEKLSQRTSFELKSDYKEMFSYMETFRNYELFGQKWIQEAITGDTGSVYYDYYQNLNTQFAALRKLMDEVNTIEDQVTKLPAINIVEADDYNSVLTVYNAYTMLSSDQKACFTTNLYTKLLALKKRCEILLLSDEETGVSLDANFAPLTRILVETFDEQAEFYTNAQAAIINAVKDENKPRAVISVYRVKTTGAASQAETGDIRVTLPIPENYRQYVRFAVYEMATDGTITTVPDMTIAGDGKTVSFTSKRLTTYVLTTKANLVVNEVQEDTYGTFLGLDLDVEMIRTMAIIGTVLFVIIIVVVVIAGIRHRRFLNTYNRAYKSGIYRRGIQNIPKGNTRPRRNPNNKKERVHDQKGPY